MKKQLTMAVPNSAICPSPLSTRPPDRHPAFGRWLILALALATSATATLAQEVTLIVSAKTGERLTSQPKTRFAPLSGPQTNSFRIDDKVTHQTIAGFGASFLEAGIVCLNTLPHEAQGKVLEALFDPVRGAGFSAMKTPLAGTDFMSAGPWYTYDDTRHLACYKVWYDQASMTVALRRISLSQRIILAMVAGVLLGWLLPAAATRAQVISTVFLHLIECVIVALIFAMLVGLGKLVATLYGAFLCFIAFVLVPVMLGARIPVLRFFKTASAVLARWEGELKLAP